MSLDSAEQRLECCKRRRMRLGGLGVLAVSVLQILPVLAVLTILTVTAVFFTIGQPRG